MIPLTVMLWLVTFFFATLGLRRGWKNEILSSGSLFLAIFAIFQIDGLLRNSILRFASLTHLFILQSATLLLVFFFSHIYASKNSSQEPAASLSWRSLLLRRSMGGVLGGFNGFFLATSLWYLLDINLYPFSPMISAPAAGSPAATTFSHWALPGLFGGPVELLTLGAAISLLVYFFKF